MLCKISVIRVTICLLLVADQLKIQVQDRKVAAFRQFNAPVEENVQNISNRYSTYYY